MTLFQAIILGLVQGLTEFFPVSSSAHLKLTKWLLGMQDGEHLLYFDLLCHAGTLLALILFLRRDIWDVLKEPKKIALFFLALLPLVPAYFLLKPVRMIASDPSYLGYALMVTGLLLFAATGKKQVFATGTVATMAEQDKEKSKRSALTEEDRFIKVAASSEEIKWRHVLCIGIMQTMALIPGISRSGSTIAMGRFCGWSWREAARFSFLLAVPTILGGELLETLKGHGEGVSGACYTGGFLASFGVGLLSVRFVFWIYEKGWVRPFAWYCLGLGLAVWALFHG